MSQTSPAASTDSLPHLLRALPRRGTRTTLAIVLLAACASLFIVLDGGPPSVVTHFMYAPILLAAYAHGARAGLLTGMAAGILVGPVLGVGTGEIQRSAGELALHWGVRTLWFAAVGGLVGYAVHQSRVQAERLTDLRFRDPLSSLPNLTAIRRHLNRLSRRRDAGERDRVTVIALRVQNHDKLVETFGHRNTALVFRTFADSLRKRFGAGLFVGRSGPDRMTIVHDGAGGVTRRELMAEIDRLAGSPVELDGVPVFLDIATGIARERAEETDPAELVSKADVAANRAVAEGSEVAVYNYRKESDFQHSLKLLGEVERAIADNEFRLVFQPSLDLRTRRLRGAEALARWQHPERGLVSPGTFIPMIEQTRMVDTFTRWTVEQALTQLAEWHANGTSASVAVNLSARNLNSDHLLRFINDRLVGLGIDPCGLELEITERSLLNVKGSRLRQLEALREAGVGIAVDDFGTGYASLAYLRSLPITTLKLDRSFITGMPNQPYDFALVRRIIQMAHDLGLEVVGEGVEDARTLIQLRRLDCDAAQGFYIARPVEAAQAEALMREGWPKRHILDTDDADITDTPA
ncbi:putative bifunctional diguanylate cyclase/phosphodiesterase [Arhodomonas aquaeolei]|uniref:putative bifunctional diguanylate cyclase/phosphodiesterase n=1 Tax=Arhodomonas aquaeolei TaxID=2369 RepID=UPI000361CE4A|nr:GGDEF domain-containing phosphodiesterase [Arhodomonas aquaeolei]